MYTVCVYVSRYVLWSELNIAFEPSTLAVHVCLEDLSLWRWHLCVLVNVLCCVVVIVY